MQMKHYIEPWYYRYLHPEVLCHLKIIQGIEKSGNNIISSNLGKNMDIQIPSVSNLIKGQTCSIILDCLNNTVCQIYENYFEKKDNHHKNNQNQMKLLKVKLETGTTAFYFLITKRSNTLPQKLGV